MRVVGLGHGVVGHVGVEVFPAASAMMLRVDKVNVARATGNQVAQVMQGTGEDAVASAAFAASRTRSISVVTASSNDPRLGQIFRFGDPHSAVRQVLSGTRHGKALLGQVFPARKLQHLPRSVTVNLPVLML